MISNYPYDALGSVNATAPAEQNRNPLARLTQRLFIDEEPVRETMCHKVSRFALKTLSLAIGAAGSYFFIPISTQFAGSKTGYGATLAMGNMGSFTALNTWSLFNIVDDFLAPKHSEEEEIENARLPSTCCSRTLKPLTIPGGLICQIPLAYQAYTYNNKNAVAGLFTLLSDAGIPIYSLLLMANQYMRKQSLTKFETQLATTKEILIDRLQRNEQGLVELEKNQRDSEIQRLGRVQSLTAALQEIFRPIGSAQEQEHYLRSFGRAFFAVVGGAFLTTARLLNFGVLGYKAMELFGTPSLGCYAGASVIAGCYFWLTQFSMVTTVGKTYDTAINLLSRKLKPNLSFILNPRLYSLLLFVGLGFDSLSFAPSVQVPKDNFSGDLQTAMLALLPMSSILMVIHALTDLIQDAVLNYSGICGSEEEKKLTELHNRYQRLSRAIALAPPVQFATFVQSLPTDLRNDCLSSARIKETDMANYLSRSPNSLLSEEL